MCVLDMSKVLGLLGAKSMLMAGGAICETSAAPQEEDCMAGNDSPASSMPRYGQKLGPEAPRPYAGLFISGICWGWMRGLMAGL